MNIDIDKVKINLTPQEFNIINFLCGKNEINLFDLAIFAKEPTKVKKQTLQKTVSDIKRKYTQLGLQPPFNCKICVDQTIVEKPEPVLKIVESAPKIEEPILKVVEEIIIPMRITLGGNRVTQSNTDPDAKIDFQLDKLNKRVKTRKSGSINLSDNEWELFCFLHENADKMVSIEDIKNVVYKNFGSKTPHCWADSIKRTLTKLRINIRELKTDNRLVTIMGGNITQYMLK